MRDLMLTMLTAVLFSTQAVVERAAHADGLPCSTIQAGNIVLPSYDCLNDELREKATARRLMPAPTPGPAQAALGSPDSIGSTTPAGGSLRFGKNFGVSASPSRPGPMLENDPTGSLAAKLSTSARH